MKRIRTSRTSAALLAGALALTLAACSSETAPETSPSGDNTETPAGETTPDETQEPEAPALELSGELPGAGASSQEKAVQGWIAGFNDSHPNVLVSYDPGGSGAGREQFIAAGTLFAGSDSALKPEEVEAATARCFGAEPLQLPLYISPIAIVVNLPEFGGDHINLSGETVAKIYQGEITNWNDAEIAAHNDGVALPDQAIIPVHRSDKSGTTGNFTDWLNKASNGAWPHEKNDEWPLTGGQSGAQTQGVIDTVSGAVGAIGYVDASRAGDLTTVAIQVGDDYVPFSAEGAAKTLDVAPRSADATDKQLVISLDRATTEEGAYPLVLVAYSIACSAYDNQSDVDNVREYFTYVASAEGQARAADPTVAGSAPISDALRAEIQALLDDIQVAS